MYKINPSKKNDEHITIFKISKELPIINLDNLKISTPKSLTIFATELETSNALQFESHEFQMSYKFEPLRSYQIPKRAQWACTKKVLV